MLLAETAFAKDGPAVQKAMTSTRLTNETIQTPPLTKTLEQLQTPTDQGDRLDTFRIFREYGAYTIIHSEVYNAFIHFLGEMTFGPEAAPSDALALAASTAFMMLVADRTNVNQNIPAHTRTMATKAAHFSYLSDAQIETCCKSLTDKETLEQFWTLYGILINRNRDTCTMVTDALWQMSQYIACKLLCLPLPPVPCICETPTKEFMRFAAHVRKVELSKGESISLNTDGELVYNGCIYKAVGYCQEGIMLSLVREGGNDTAKSIALDRVLGYYLKEHETRFFFRTLPHHNMKSSRDSCAGCSASSKSNDMRLFVYNNALVSSDLKGAKDFEVHKDGTVSFSAQVLMHDRVKGKVVRTGYKQQRCEAYDIQSLLGFDVRACSGLSSMFASGLRGHVTTVKSQGIFVRSTIERMDDYYTDADGNITSIRHGPIQKWADRDGSTLIWSDKGDEAFTLDDIVR